MKEKKNCGQYPSCSFRRLAQGSEADVCNGGCPGFYIVGTRKRKARKTIKLDPEEAAIAAGWYGIADNESMADMPEDKRLLAKLRRFLEEE